MDRKGRGPALRRMLRAAQRAVAEARKIVIFPEGTRTAPGEVRASEPGVAVLAGLGVPVATGSGAYWGRSSFVRRPGVLTVAVLPPEPPGQLRGPMPRRAQSAVEAEALRPPCLPLWIKLWKHPPPKLPQNAKPPSQVPEIPHACRRRRPWG